jgi:hypothetical protein
LFGLWIANLVFGPNDMQTSPGSHGEDLAHLRVSVYTVPISSE